MVFGHAPSQVGAKLTSVGRGNGDPVTGLAGTTEVLSPTDNSVEIQQKVRDYLESGARLVGIISPQAKTVTVYRADDSARLPREDNNLEGEDVLPGFRIPLATCFANRSQPI